MEFVNESNVTDLEGVEAGQNNSRMRRIKQPDQQVNRPSIVEPTGRFPIEIKTKKRYHIISFYHNFTAKEQSQMQYDSTGMYHWCPSRNINDCLMDRQEAAMTILQVIH